MKLTKNCVVVFFLMMCTAGFSQSERDKILTEISTATSAERIERDIKTLVNFGTRHTLSGITLENIVIDNYLFGVASIGKYKAESLIQFPQKLISVGL